MNKIIIEDLDFILKSNIDWEKFKNKTIFITGASGMLLSYIVYSLLKLNELDSKFNINVIALVNDKEKAKNRFKYFVNNKNLKFFEHDLSSPIKISENIDYIIHGASYASPYYFKTNPVAVLLPNIIGTHYLLELAKSKKIKSFLFFSSGAVYGKPVKGEKVMEKDYGYLDPLDITNCYSESKKMGENMCKCWNYQFGIPIKIVRPAHIYGPTMDIKNDSRVFANFVNNIVMGQNIILKSDGSPCRSFCYIADATVAFLKVLLDGVDGEAYNVGNNAGYISIKELAETFVSVLPEKRLKVIFEKQTGKKHKDKEGKMLVSSEKIKSLGWKCAFSIKKGIKRTVESFMNQ